MAGERNEPAVCLHPMGTGSMAAQKRLQWREAGDMAMHGNSQPMMPMDAHAMDAHATHTMPSMSAAAPTPITPRDVSFPLAFPSAGRYRVFVPLRRASGVIETAALDVTVPEGSAAR